MKQVTMESVKQRIADLESAGKVVGGLSLSSEFELACLRELVAVTEQRDALVAENAALKTAVEGVHQELYGQGFEVAGWHLNGDLQSLDSWFEENDWNPETPATDAAIAALRAEGVEMFAMALRVPGDDPFMDAIAVGVAGTADNFARQLRESKGEVQS